MASNGRTPAIADYAVIGDCRSAGLISREGSLDWLCWPRFDSPSIFGRLLDPGAGHFRVAPRGVQRVRRRYIPETNVLETRFETATGIGRMTDLMPITSEEDKRRLLVADHEVLRVVTCEAGRIDLKVEYAPRPRYGRVSPRLVDAGALGIRCETDEGLLALRSDLGLVVQGDRARATTRLTAGDVRHLSLTFSTEGPAVLPPLGDRCAGAIARSVDWWRAWAGHLAYDGPARDAVIRSALVLKLMVYAPSGAVVAAPTTSLPERIGGELNWDYRYCWLRDASLTLRALFGLGCRPEADAFMGWLLHSTALTQPELKILYDVFGNAPAAERVLDRLSGYRGSRPVRVGNAAADQLQLDTYGEVIDAAARWVGEGATLDHDTQRMLTAFGEYVCRNWQRPDAGIWEPRGEPEHNTHSRVLCWAALDRLVELHERGHLSLGHVERFRENRGLLRREILDRGWSEALGCYVSRLDGQEVDASQLRMAWYGFEDAASERMRATYERIREQLGAGGHLLYRYRVDGPGEGAFGICSFWGAEHLAMGGGTLEEASQALESLCGYANDLGLFAEEIDPESGAPLGNFPQAFTHVGLINAALSLRRRMRQEGADAAREARS